MTPVTLVIGKTLPAARDWIAHSHVIDRYADHAEPASNLNHVSGKMVGAVVVLPGANREVVDHALTRLDRQVTQIAS